MFLVECLLLYRINSEIIFRTRFIRYYNTQVVITDKYPVALHYVAHLDQVWVLNWRSVYDDGVKTIQVIRDASQKRKHHTVHPEPIDGQFDLVRDLFMPTAQVRASNVLLIEYDIQHRLQSYRYPKIAQDLSHWFKYGYVSHANQRGLYKLDLANMRYIRSIDLSPYNCVPRTLQFSSLCKYIIIDKLIYIISRLISSAQVHRNFIEHKNIILPTCYYFIGNLLYTLTVVLRRWFCHH